MDELSQFLTIIKKDPLEAGTKAALCGLNSGALAFVISSAAKVNSKPFLIITATEEKAEQTVKDLNFFLPPDLSASHFPAWDVQPYDDLPPFSGVSGIRIQTLFRLIQEDCRLVVSSVRALAQRLIPRTYMTRAADLVLAGEGLDRNGLLRQLTEWGYQFQKLVESPGTFSYRGGIVDIFQPHQKYPVRLEFFGDVVDSIRFFDPSDQRSIDNIEELTLLPAREYLWNKEMEQDLPQKILRFRKKHRFTQDIIEAVTQSVSEPGSFTGQPWLMSLWYDNMDTLFDYFSAPPLLFIDNPLEVKDQAADWWGQIEEGHERTSAEKLAVSPPEELYMQPEEIQSRITGLPCISMSEFLQDNEIPQDRVFYFHIKTQDTVRKELLEIKGGEEAFRPLVNRFQKWEEENFRVAVVCRTRSQANRLFELLSPYDISFRISPSAWSETPDDQQRGIVFYIGELTKGFVMPEALLAIITEEEIFGTRRPVRTPRGKKEILLSSFGDLKVNDYVVHLDHGIGQYRGLIRLKADKVEADFLEVEYQRHDRLFVPIYNLETVQKYVGADKSKPPLDVLGGKGWEKRKRKVKSAVNEIAAELLELYAARSALSGFAYPENDNFYYEFSATFPFEETQDQTQAIADVLEDMGKSRPMDRLVCGDVGFGKTEVAIRAAFKAVSNNKQVSVLVPTTILAQQHENSFRERFRGYPVNIESLSRFKSRTEQKQILSRLKEGRIDIIIGTHRLLQKDVEFKDLGVLIIDEEHRFGVKHKEALKKMRRLVDVLTLTATPIPRTLHLSLMGLRDLSVINTPPEDRHAIQTMVQPFRPDVIRGAIMREINRNGQCFFVHNRVHSINRMGTFLSKLVPEARFVVAHGQMNEAQLERVMAKYIQREFDVLVSTTIIESGLDIPSTNTIIINRADQLGLAELYQLRGRVGRASSRAYAYLLVPPRRMLTRVSRRRLRAIQDFTELGSGYKLAMQDLEIRGAGHMLGARQSGHIAAVGFEMYNRLMEQTIRIMKGETVPESIEPEISLPIPAYIPENYIPDTNQRLEIYKRLAGATDDKEVDEMANELTDRYGAPSLLVENLIKMTKIKILLKKLYISRLSMTDHTVYITFHEHCPITPGKIIDMVQKSRDILSFSPEMVLTVKLQQLNENDIFSYLKNLLNEFSRFVKF